MEKQKENKFLNKFRFLNSQENTEEIIWSPSDSSEYEEHAVNEKFNNITNMKRKRKKKTPNNVPNLCITVLDTSESSKELRSGKTSPILISKKHQKSLQLSPILALSQARHFSSPVLPLRYAHEKSPILASKSSSPQAARSVKKKLFNKECDLKVTKEICNIKTECDSNSIENNNGCRSSFSELSIRTNVDNTSAEKSELVTKVRSFFDSHFSSESSQNSQSISEIKTQTNSNTSDDVEILTCKTRTSDSVKLIKQEKSDHKDSYTYNKCKKKVRYKKDGIAYRLNNLLKKQNACLSLWQHERFLAANSNFILPKEEYTVFRIKNVHIKYGCYLLEAVDLNEEEFLVLINSFYVSVNIICDTIIKVYKPYKVIQLNRDNKLLLHVCRFECSHYMA